MDVLDAIFTRRSIRKFTDEKVTAQELETILRAGFSAPTAHNFKPWDFVVLEDKEVLKDCAEHGKWHKMLPFADKVVVICGNSITQNNHDLLVNDCSAATENMLLAAHGLGLGAVWCGLVQPEMVEYYQNLLKAPEGVIPMAIVAIGHADQNPTAENRYNKDRVFYGSF